ncbi:hypothetical protein LJ739_07440 [Aestuariibacter halophilus]|uniref:Uncharacterized protein n=1 Tax=Fluctibacter halophilus TaxID=226011 RepID=A0ABS8G699_9ALTE|nr:hypothetical protein [Aestuariibacter halophilus]MCC2616070.1 hypothetical protein [Aestuariibacter halophilus]
MRSLLIFILLTSASFSVFAQEQAVIVHFYNYGSKDLTRLFALEDKLEKAITKSGVGEYDGNEIAVDGSDGFLYMYGPDADRLFLVVKPILEETPFTKGADVTKRYGPPESSTKEAHVIIAH